MPIVKSQFRPAWWLRNPHLQTIWPTFMRPRPRIPFAKERLELADGDFLDLCWSGPQQGKIIVLLHGLEGTLNSHYARSHIESLNHAGFRTCFMHFRGCSGEHNRLARSYHSGETGDFQTVIEHITRHQQREVFAAIGVSLGGNVLLKWLGEQKNTAGVSTAIAISVPFMLADAASRLDSGFSRLYQRHLLRLLREKHRNKHGALNGSPPDLQHLTNFYMFDHNITAPLHGFSSADEYYRKCSSRPFLRDISVPTLILHSRDDPFMWPHTTPDPTQVSPWVNLELSNHGGHVGFIAGHIPFRPVYWLETRILEWLNRPNHN